MYRCDNSQEPWKTYFLLRLFMTRINRTPTTMPMTVQMTIPLLIHLDAWFIISDEFIM